MKTRTSGSAAAGTRARRASPVPANRRTTEFKGVVKKITGTLTNDPVLEREGQDEMIGRKEGKKAGDPPRRSEKLVNPDPHRRG